MSLSSGTIRAIADSGRTNFTCILPCMVTACCHFLYPIVLNPWCESCLAICSQTQADHDSAPLPVLNPLSLSGLLCVILASSFIVVLIGLSLAPKHIIHCIYLCITRLID